MGRMLSEKFYWQCMLVVSYIIIIMNTVSKNIRVVGNMLQISFIILLQISLKISSLPLNCILFMLLNSSISIQSKLL